MTHIHTYTHIHSQVFGIWTAMTNKIIGETYTETDKFARATITCAMTKNHHLAGEWHGYHVCVYDHMYVYM